MSSNNVRKHSDLERNVNDQAPSVKLKRNSLQSPRGSLNELQEAKLSYNLEEVEITFFNFELSTSRKYPEPFSLSVP